MMSASPRLTKSGALRTVDLGLARPARSGWRLALINTFTGAITRAFAVSSSAGHASPTRNASTSFETMFWRCSHASGPATRT